uniref:Uncharacterized protein n=1 Tax=Timema tahoe TaxID=61484 RepID=A0A7R9FP69_9NEOP|nr:unnamed protein product [Timema tahoe]
MEEFNTERFINEDPVDVPRIFEEGSNVAFCSYIKPEKRWLLGIVKEKKGDLHYLITQGDTTYFRHVDQMRPVGEELNRQNMNTNGSQTPSSNLRPSGRSIAVEPSEPPLLSAPSTSPKSQFESPTQKKRTSPLHERISPRSRPLDLLQEMRHPINEESVSRGTPARLTSTRSGREFSSSNVKFSSIGWAEGVFKLRGEECFECEEMCCGVIGYTGSYDGVVKVTVEGISMAEISSSNSRKPTPMHIEPGTAAVFTSIPCRVSTKDDFPRSSTQTRSLSTTPKDLKEDVCFICNDTNNASSLYHIVSIDVTETLKKLALEMKCIHICGEEEWKIVQDKPRSVHLTGIEAQTHRLGNLIYCESDALNHVANEADASADDGKGEGWEIGGLRQRSVSQQSVPEPIQMENRTDLLTENEFF